MRKKVRNTKGITLIALIITIIILLILAIVTIRILMNQGIIRHAENATNNYVIAEEKEKIALGYQNYKMDKIANPNAVLTVDTATVEGSEAEGGWTITFRETGNVYELNVDGSITRKEDPTQDEIAKIRAGYNKYQSDKSNVSQTDLDLLRQYCIGNNDKDLLEDILDANTMTFKDNEPIPNASTELTYTGMDQAEVNGNYELYIYFNYNGNGYKLTSGLEYSDGNYSYPTKKVEAGAILTVDGAYVEGNEEIGWTITFENTGNKYTLDKNGKIEVAKQVILNKAQLKLLTITNKTTGTVIASFKGNLNGDINWTIANENVAKITETKGKEVTVQAIASGYTSLTAECEGYTASCSINVTDPIGGYIDYDCYTNVDSSKLYYKSLGANNGYGDQEFQVTANPKWKILGVSDSGHILITTADPVHVKDSTYFALKGRAGYVNGPAELDTISKIFGHGAHAVAENTRSITVEDVNKITGRYLNDTYTKYTYTKNPDDGKIYRNDATSSKYSTYWYYENDDPTGTWKTLETGETSPEIAHTEYTYSIGITSKALKMISTDDNDYYAYYWLASRSVNAAGNDLVGFHMRSVYKGKIDNIIMSNSIGGDYTVCTELRCATCSFSSA